MKMFLITASAIALSTPALAQMEPATPTTTTSPTTGQPTTGQPATGQPTTGQPMPGTPAMPDQSMPMAEAPATVTTPSDPKALIASEFPTYDKNADGKLDKVEFASWMVALRAKTDAKPMAAPEMTKWSDGAFATADKDKSKAVTLAELQSYLTQGA